MSHLSKAILEAALGEAGTVGVMKLDDFLVKLKTAMHELLAAQSWTSIGRVSRLPADLPLAESVAGREGSDSGSLVPTVFGDPGSLSVSGDATSGPAIFATLSLQRYRRGTW